MEKKYRHVWDARYIEGAIYIDPEMIKMASEEGRLKLLARENDDAVLGGNFNIYIGINRTYYVLLHIKENYYTVINQRVWCVKTQRWIQVVKRFANGFHFNINNGEVTTQPRQKYNSKKKTLSIYRIIMSLALYNEVDMLNSIMDVHHVLWRYLNTINCLRYVDEYTHRKFHYKDGNRSKRNGLVIDNYQEFLDLLEEIKRADEMASILPM